MVKYDDLLKNVKVFTKIDTLDGAQQKAVVREIKVAFEKIGIKKKIVDGVTMAHK